MFRVEKGATLLLLLSTRLSLLLSRHAPAESHHRLSHMASPDPITNGARPRAPSSSPPLSSTAPRAPPPPEIESTLSRLSAYRNVRGVMVLARSSGAPGSGGIVQSTGAVFEGESGRRYAGSLEAVVNATAGAVATVDEGVSVPRVLCGVLTT